MKWRKVGSVLHTTLEATVAPAKGRRVCVYLPAALYQKLLERKAELGVKSISEYVRHLIYADLQAKGGLK